LNVTFCQGKAKSELRRIYNRKLCAEDLIGDALPQGVRPVVASEKKGRISVLRRGKKERSNIEEVI
jgi:hypothetical protein